MSFEQIFIVANNKKKQSDLFLYEQTLIGDSAKPILYTCCDSDNNRYLVATESSQKNIPDIIYVQMDSKKYLSLLEGQITVEQMFRQEDKIFSATWIDELKLYKCEEYNSIDFPEKKLLGISTLYVQKTQELLDYMDIIEICNRVHTDESKNDKHSKSKIQPVVDYQYLDYLDERKNNPRVKEHNSWLYVFFASIIDFFSDYFHISANLGEKGKNRQSLLDKLFVGFIIVIVIMIVLLWILDKFFYIL